MEADAEMGEDHASSPVAGIPEAIMDADEELLHEDEVSMADVPPAEESAVPGLGPLPTPLPLISSTTTTPIFAPHVHPGFISPPLVVCSEDGLQVSALGHSAADPEDATSYFATAEPLSESRSASPPNSSAPAADAQLTTNGTTNGHHRSPSPKVEGTPPTVNGHTNDVGAVGESTETPTLVQSHARDDLDRPNALAAQHQRSDDRSQSQEQFVENIGEHETRVTQRQSQERGDADEPAVQENEVVVRQTTDEVTGKERVDVSMDQTNKGDPNNNAGPAQQINHVKVYKRGDDCASCTHSGGTMSRPTIHKSLLSVVDLEQLLDETRDVETPEDGEDPENQKALVAPTVLLTHNGMTYSLFQRYSPEEDAADLRVDVDSSLPVLFGEGKDHELYYDQVESFIEALHGILPELSSRQDEVILAFEAIGINLPEDNVYTREVCLYDFDRVHVGCGLAGRLHITLEFQTRFSTGFNALAQHIANSNTSVTEEIEDPFSERGFEPPDIETYTRNVLPGPIDEATVTEIPSEAETTEVGAADPTGDEGGEGTDGVLEEFQDGEWAAEEIFEGEVEESFEGGADENVEGEELEQNYEVLGDEDLEAAIEGAEEDFIASETAGEATAADDTAEYEAGGEEVGEGEVGSIATGDINEQGKLAEVFGEEADSGELGERNVGKEMHLEQEESLVVKDEPEGSVSTSGSKSSGATSGTTDLTSEEPSAVLSPDQASSTAQANPAIHVDATGLVSGQEAESLADDIDLGADDIVIDYEEAFYASALPSPAPPDAIDLPEAPMSPSSKRCHEDVEGEYADGEGTLDEAASTAAKRARVTDPSPAISLNASE
ncbi:hypothetical protein P7C70_g8977, partial [Phenoliferia sp. Uapishka_3]